MECGVGCDRIPPACPRALVFSLTCHFSGEDVLKGMGVDVDALLSAHTVAGQTPSTLHPPPSTFLLPPPSSLLPPFLLPPPSLTLACIVAGVVSGFKTAAQRNELLRVRAGLRFD
jgi:hypothetical protein